MTAAERLEIVVRQVRQSDIAGLATALLPEVSFEQVSQRWREHRDGNRKMFVAALEEDLTGTISIGGSGRSLRDSLRWFALDVGLEFRRHGVGTALIQAAEEEARHQGFQQVNLEVAVDNVDAIRLYEQLGYHRLADRVVDRWWRLSDDGSREEVEELSWLMVKWV